MPIIKELHAALQDKQSSTVNLSPTTQLVGQRYRLPRISQQGEYISKDKGGEPQREIHCFLGVPFAEPPVGPLRFKDPVPLPLWTGERTATEYGPACPQDFNLLKIIPFRIDPPDQVSEDCLYLNVWTPTTSRDAALPVMVWIYGGGFIMGFTDFYRGDALVTHHDVVVVTIAYRVGPLGFLCTGDAESTGNYGLMDQIEALRWVNKYIANFGGDPNNVTVFGESAGGVSVSYLIMSPLTRGLIKNCISESGTALTLGDMYTPAQGAKAIKPYLQYLDSKVTDSKGIVEVFHGAPADKLVLPTTLSLNAPAFMQPVMDGKSLTKNLHDFYTTDDVPKVNYMIGCNRDEGAFSVFGLPKLMEGPPMELTPDIIPMFLKMSLAAFYLDKDTSRVVEAIQKEYFEGVTEKEDLMKKMVELLGDIHFIHSSIKMASYHSVCNPVYFYSFEKRPGFEVLPDWVHSDHASEVSFVLGMPFLYHDMKFTDEDRELSKKMMSYWTNFAKTGNPNGPGLEEWPVYNNQTKKHLTLDSPIHQSKDLRAQREKFWDEVVPKLF